MAELPAPAPDWEHIFKRAWEQISAPEICGGNAKQRRKARRAAERAKR